jgi:hypothetical protein
LEGQWSSQELELRGQMCKFGFVCFLNASDLN